jgi:hypothetical protein
MALAQGGNVQKREEMFILSDLVAGYIARYYL